MTIWTHSLVAAAFGMITLTAGHAQEASSNPVDEDYREQFRQCDLNDAFGGITL